MDYAAPVSESSIESSSGKLNGTEMTSTLAQIAAVAAGLAVSATAFIWTSRSPLKAVAAAVALCVVAALLITIARNFG